MPPKQNLTYLDFQDEVESGKIKNVYFISAYDNYFVSRAAELLKEKLFGSKDNNENYFIRYADEAKYTEVLDLCSNFTSIFSPRKLVVLKKCEKLGRALQQILIYTEKPDEDTVLLLVFDKDYVIEKKLNTDEFGFYEFSELPRKYYFQWIGEQFKNRGCSIDEPEVELFASSVPYNYEIAGQEIEKISNHDFGGNQKIISKEIILNFIGFDKTYTPDDLMVSILEKDKKRSMDIVDYLLNKSGINEIYLLTIISGCYTDLICFKTAGFSNKNPSEYYNKYKIWRDRVDFAKAYHHKIKAEELDKVFSNLLETDRKIKTSMIDPKILVTSLVKELINV